MKFSGKVNNGPSNECLNFGCDPDHHLDTEIVFQDSSLLRDTECAINRLRCATLQCRACTIAGIAIGTMTSLRHRPTTDSHERRRALAEVCTVPVLLVYALCSSTADANTTRVMFVFEDGRRLSLDVDDRRLVGEVRERVRRTLRLDEETSGSQSGQRKTLFVSFAGAVLDVSWRFADIGIPSGAQVRLPYGPL